MTNVAEQLLDVFRGHVGDVEDILELQGELVGDFEVVSKSVKSRGLSVLLLDLPSECKALEQALDSGVMVPRPGAPFTRGGYPRLWIPIYDKIFTDDWLLKEDVDPLVIRCFRQLLKGLKKFRTDCPPEALKEKIREFIEIEDRIVDPVGNWGETEFRLRGSDCDLGRILSRAGVNSESSSGLADPLALEHLSRDVRSIQELADSLISSFSSKGLRFMRCRHGPGAVSESYESSKFEFPSWPPRLEHVFPFSDYGMLNWMSYDDELIGDHESPCKLIDVPKDYSGPRLIASEPISSQFIQQGIMSVLRDNVKKSVLRHCIDFRSQEPSRALALRSSSKRDFATIDLSSASDRLSTSVVEAIFRRNPDLLAAFNAARTPDILLPDGRVLRMKKFAAQGAAFTFPVQTIVYAIICMGVCRSYFGESVSLANLARKVRVYGDDMIVPTDVFARTCSVLEALGLKVNLSKSFSRGAFRESCGLDAYDGTEVTTSSVNDVFDMSNPVTLVSVVECANNLYEKGFVRSSSALLDTIPLRIRKDIPVKRYGSTAFGLIGGGQRPHKSRYNGFLHRTEVKVLTVASKVTKTKPSGRYALFQWFIEKPSPESTTWEPGEVISVKARYGLRWVPESDLWAVMS